MVRLGKMEQPLQLAGTTCAAVGFLLCESISVQKSDINRHGCPHGFGGSLTVSRSSLSWTVGRERARSVGELRKKPKGFGN